MFLRRLCRPICWMSAPPMNISEPVSATTIRNRAWIMLDFPAPVRPTIPTFWPPSILKLISLSTGSNFSLYLIEKCLNSTLATAGQLLVLLSGEAYTPYYSFYISSLNPIDLSYSVRRGASDSRLATANSRSTLTMILSMLMICRKNHCI